MNPNDVAPLILGTISIAAIWSLLSIWLKNRGRGKQPSVELKEISDRLARMEQAIDAMAVETERISEAQRFTTKLLSDAPKISQPR